MAVSALCSGRSQHSLDRMGEGMSLSELPDAKFTTVEALGLYSVLYSSLLVIYSHFHRLMGPLQCNLSDLSTMALRQLL